MSELQWALLAVAVIVVAGVYLHARRQAAKQAVWARRGKDAGAEAQLDIFDDNQGFDEFGVGQARNRAEPQLDDPGEPSGEAATPASELMVLHVCRSDLQYLDGEQLHQALQHCGLEFGAHDIYHRFSPEGQAIYSVASMVKPGFLRPDEVDELSTPGVTLFLQLPGPLDGSMALEDLLQTANTLAERFSGSLLDKSRQPLNDEALAQMRERCKVYRAQ